MVVRVGHQGGHNLTLAYKRNDVMVAYRLRCVGISHGFTQLGDESAGRRHRAFYPHQVVPARFTLTVDLLGRKRNLQDGIRKPLSAEHTEYEGFNVWLNDYMNYMLEQDEKIKRVFPEMIVSCPVRGFYRWGIPLGPIVYGDHVGSLVWRQSITFETTREQKDIVNGKVRGFPISKFYKPEHEDENSKYFYPLSKQLTGSQRPDYYDPIYPPVATPPDSSDVQDATGGDYLSGTDSGGRGGEGDWGTTPVGGEDATW